MAQALGVSRHIELDVDLAAFGGSALVGDGDDPEGSRRSTPHDIPSTYVPARNTVFLSLALAWAEVLGADAIVIGVNALDYSGYPDCRPEYLEAFESMAGLATKAGVEGARLRIHAPLLRCRRPRLSAADSRSASTTASPTAATIRAPTARPAAAATAACCAPGFAELRSPKPA